MTAITTTIFPDAEAWLIENLPHMEVDTVAAVYPLTNFTPTGTTSYHDAEEGITRSFTLTDHVRALRQLCELVDGKKLYVGCVRGSADLTDSGNWDIEVVDAYFQLVFHGEMIYG